jgi:hypothetical protein
VAERIDEKRPRPAGSLPTAFSGVLRAFLRKLERTSDRRKRLAILKACARAGAPWVESLYWEALTDTCEEVRDYLVRDLSSRPAFDLDHALHRLRRPPWYARSSVLRVLGAHKARAAVPEIQGVIDDTNVDVRRAAAEALGEIGGDEALALLVRLRKDANPYVRSAAEEGILKASTLRFS